MSLYYGVITIATLMFSLQFLFNQQFEKQCGSGPRSTLVFFSGYSAAGLLVLLIINGFVLNSALFPNHGNPYCSERSGLYRLQPESFRKNQSFALPVFSMLGGMMLPFSSVFFLR